MKKLYEKNELTVAIVWIAAYCVLQSLANPLNEIIGVQYAASAGFCILQTIVLFAFIRKNNLQKRYGLCGSSVPARRFLYYVPLVILASGNLWNGAAVNYSPAETACRIACMLCVGFLEEVIFRGLLFRAIARDNIKAAVIISSVTFGIGHNIPIHAFPVAVFLFRKPGQGDCPVELLVFLRRYPEADGNAPEPVVAIHILS